MSSEVEGTGPLAAEDARALSRLLRRTFGRGFRLVVIEVATPRLRQRILEWLGAEVEALRGEVLELDVGALPGQNLWSELVERLEQRDQGVERERVVLALHGFQAAARGQPDAQSGLYRQLNVQRDLFVRDLGCFWVLLIDPHGSRKLQDIAPDFCDFTSLWIEAPRGVGELRLRDDAARPMTHDGSRAVTLKFDESQPELLQKAAEAIAAGRYAQARDLLTRFELAADAAGEDDGRALLLRGYIELRRGNFDAARRAGEQGLAWSLALGERGKSETADALHLLGGVFEAQGKYEQARTSLERSLAIQQDLYGTQEHPNVAASLHELARVHNALGDTQEARRLFERALKNHDNPEAVAVTLHEIASLSHKEGDYDGARRALEQLLAVQTQLLGTELHPAVATIHHSLAMALRAQGDFDAARQHVERSLEIEAKVLETELHPNVASSLHELANIMREQGDFEGARRQYERSLEIATQAIGMQSHPSVAATLHALAHIQWEQGDLEGARRQFERVLAIVIEVFGTELHPNVATALHSLAMLLAEQGELDEAAAAYERALNIDARVQGPDHHSTCAIEVAFAQLLLDTGERDRAEALLLHARPILANVLGPTHPRVQHADALLEACARTASA